MIGNGKTSVFVSYAALVLVGFGGTALLGMMGKSNDTAAVVAFLGFYGFLCTTGAFYVIGKQKASLDTLTEHINVVNESHWKENENIYRRLNDDMAEFQRETDKKIDSMWANIDRIDNTLDECTTCTPSKK